MKLARLLTKLIALGLASSALATSLPEPATLANMAGAWMGLGQWGSHYRLLIDQSGHGQLAIRGTLEKVFLYRIDSIAFEGQSVKMRLRFTDEPQSVLKVKGDAWLGSMTLRGERVFGNDSVRFYPEAERLERQAAVRAAMQPGAP